MIKKMISCVVLVLVASMLSVFFTKNKMEDVDRVNKANLLLYDISDSVELLHLLAERNLKTHSDSDIIGVVENILIKKIVMVATLKPTIKNMQGVPLEALANVLEYSQKPGFSFSIDNEMKKLVAVYLDSIRQEVLKESKRRKKIFSNL